MCVGHRYKQARQNVCIRRYVCTVPVVPIPLLPQHEEKGMRQTARIRNETSTHDSRVIRDLESTRFDVSQTHRIERIQSVVGPRLEGH